MAGTTDVYLPHAAWPQHGAPVLTDANRCFSRCLTGHIFIHSGSALLLFPLQKITPANRSEMAISL